MDLIFISEVTYATQDIEEIRAVKKMINHEITSLTNLKQQTDENVSSINQLMKKVEELLAKQPQSTDISIEGKRFMTLFYLIL